ncbi:hypothetical protein [Photobacterium aquimaris]|uniref:Transcriptional regulator VspR n=1 Tax=Photobacterium aquimaris TaxID=512643 RepID=A0A2T3HWW9_9GAMM|nr:hypothetical protein [Photobacterium aquimaris]OBU17359.1 hypothetical protein AYY21_19830 [Photobacterium aquimaris]PQJ36621.1 hypothetical protein BTN98_20130 [Photobacterium aquimaris]PSU03504.1 hypothetical protein C0W81_12100 [Photobacterium aquimaris]
MTDLIKIHPDILMALKKVNDEQFKTTTIRDLLMQLFPRYTNQNTTRLFASRHLLDLTTKGVLTCTGIRHSKRFKKYDDFNLIKFKTKKLRKNQHVKQVVKNQTDELNAISEGCIKNLKTQKAIMEAELSIKLAETEQYQAMIEQFPETAFLALKLHSEAKENAAAIVGQIRAISNVLSYGQI